MNAAALTASYDFVCYGCDYNVAPPAAFTCPRCGEPLSIRSLATPGKAVFSQPLRSLWDYSDLLPVTDPDRAITLGEGATRLIEAPRLAAASGLKQLLLKNETSNPTGSFKDRQISVGITRARELGKDTVAVVSSGNVACAASAYAARAGMRAVLLMHGFASPTKIAQAAAYGGQVIQVDVPSANAVFDLCLEACGRFGWYHLSTAGMYEPYNVEGAKTIAYELYQQTGGDLPDWIVAPVGGGGLLGGIWRGLLDLQRLGLIERLPRLAGIQASGCAPLKKAIDEGTPYLETLNEPWPNPKTIAGGIADDILFDGHTVLPALRTTNGAAIAVDDPEIIRGELALASSEGILCEPTCAVVIAALEHLPLKNSGARVCCIITGSGIKDLPALQGHVAPPKRIGASLSALESALRA
ncbi:MAG: pyridoxal-phosphate dependent enzyme [Candidatus Hydrogenedentes bacterium]|nr:pyridoxal-phosphate dependent enzyme [Candidatus Hydrogenedentota bacterium]